MDVLPEIPTNAKEVSLSRREIFEVIKTELNSNLNKIYDLLEAEVSNKVSHRYVLPEDLKNVTRLLIMKFKEKWKQVHRTEKNFFSKHEEWLNGRITFVKSPAPDNTGISKTDTAGGRPSTSWEDMSERSKRRRTEIIRSNHSPEELAYATQMSMRASGQVNASKIIKDISEGSSLTSTRYLESAARAPEEKLSNDEALSLLIECKLSKCQYNVIRTTSLNKHSSFYPSYERVVISKGKCYPKNINVTETEASVNLQALLNHTAQRIMEAQSDVIISIARNNMDKIKLICKWGCDGTSGQSNYKQKFSDAGSNISDSDIFFISLVPLQMVCADREQNLEIVIWKNPRPSSTRFCRPIKIIFMHETAQDTKREVELMKEEQNSLVPFNISMYRRDITVTFQLALTMVDGKVLNSITETTSSMRCYLCKSTSKDFNDINAMLQLPIDENNLQFGISSLHAWIRFMECCLHLSYRLDIKTWQARKADKESVEKNKRSVQKGFKERLGLIIDQPKQNYGSSNDGNTARRFFSNFEISASITGVDIELLQRFYIILQVLSSGFPIDVQKFQKYTAETAQKFVTLYPWYYMPTTVHKILIHGHKIVNSSLLPIGQMSEEAQESCNKLIKKFREDFARKCGREQNLRDVFQRLLVTSDPLISSLRELPSKQSKPLSKEAIDLLIPPRSPESNYEFILDTNECTNVDATPYSSDSD